MEDGEDRVRYCPECGLIGPVNVNFRDCCPDGNMAVKVPPLVAEQARIGFMSQIEVQNEPA